MKKRAPQNWKTRNGQAVGLGARVRFLTDHLGASARETLWATTDEVFGVGDQGTVAFAHPNPRLADWFYVEVVSKNDPDRRLYVGVTGGLVEIDP